MDETEFKRCGAEKGTSCPCRRLHIGGPAGRPQPSRRDPCSATMDAVT